jgi:hypothetical protein
MALVDDALEARNRALAWLARHQEPDGRWDAEKHGGLDADPAVTGLATLAFATTGWDKYGPNLERAASWIIGQQAEDGAIGRGYDGGLGLNHAISGLALADAYHMLRRQREVGEAARKAMDYSVSVLQGGSGGWGPEPGVDAELVVTSWFVEQLRAGLAAELGPPVIGFQRALRFLDEVTVREGDMIGRSGNRSGEAPSPEMTAVAVLCRAHTGFKRSDPYMAGGVEYLVENPPRREEGDRSFNLTYWWFGGQIMIHYGKHWRTWTRPLMRLLVSEQCRGGDEEGSWDPERVKYGDRWGRVYAAAMGSMCLDYATFYNTHYIPIYGE